MLLFVYKLVVKIRKTTRETIFTSKNALNLAHVGQTAG